MFDHAIEWCNSLTRSYERAKQRSREIGYEAGGDEYEDLLTLRALLHGHIIIYREQIAERCAPWFEVTR